MERARAFGLVAGEYERGRPGHAAEAIRWLLRHEQTVDQDLLRALALSRSSVALLEAREQEALLDRVAALWIQEPGLQGHDSTRLGYLTRVRRCSGLWARPAGG